MNIQSSHTWRSSAHPKVRGVILGDWYYRIRYIGNPDTWEIEAIPKTGETETRYFGSRREAQEFLQSKR